MKNKKLFSLLTVVAVIAVITGVYALFKAPSLKPEIKPPVAEKKKAPSPIPGAKIFDASQYPREPQISVYMHETGAIKTMALETYLEGVLAQEVITDWPAEALAAQAVASRTITMHALEEGHVKRLRGADVSTNKNDLQAYAAEKVNDNVRAAVKKTRGEILLYAGSLVNAIYSDCNGQMSATAAESFPVEIDHDTPYFQARADTCFKHAPAYAKGWTVKIPASTVLSVLKYQGSPKDVAILERGPSGRALYLGAGDKKIHAADFRKAVGYDLLKSTLISEMTYDGQNFVFKGDGWGNGVGLCQWGAYTYAAEGMKYGDILKQYYIEADVKKIWD